MVSEKLMRWFCPLFLFIVIITPPSYVAFVIIILLLWSCRFHYYYNFYFIIISYFSYYIFIIVLITVFLFLFNNEFYKLVCFVVGFIMPRLDDTFINVLVKNVVIEPLKCELDVGFCKRLLMLLSTR